MLGLAYEAAALNGFAAQDAISGIESPPSRCSLFAAGGVNESLLSFAFCDRNILFSFQKSLAF